MKKKILAYYPYLIALLICGVALNQLGALLVRILSLPLYLDSIGTMLVAALGGYIPGIVVGYLSNLIGGMSDPTNMYFAFISVFLAFCAAIFSRKGWFKSFRGAAKAVLIFALIGGGVGSVISWLIFGLEIGDGVWTPFADQLVRITSLPPFWAKFIADMAIDLADKIITVAIVIFVLTMLPESLKKKLMMHGWKQKPLSDEERKEAESLKTRRVSLKSSIIMLMAVAAAFMATATTGISFLLYHRATIDDHTRIGQGVSELVASAIDPEKVDDYIEYGEQADGYKETVERLERLRDNAPEAEYIYVYRIQNDGCHVVFDLDSDGVEAHRPGDVVPFDVSFASYVPDLLAGRPIDPIITNESYGWLLTVYTPVYNGKGECVCYAAADISMEHIKREEISFITKVTTLFFGFFIVVIAIGLWVAEYSLLLPINTMTYAADEFTYKSEKEREDSVEKFNALEISTGDEIEKLYDSFAHTMATAVAYFSDAQKKSASLSKMQNGLILVLADLVESRDKCTGDHVRKTSAYTRTILEQMAADGVYADTVTPEFIDDVANSAPLHDVGKISVADAILNKPGKLTDEEFAIMKGHTVAGGEIITKAISLVSDSGYLSEARNLALCHHEKWNGTGYPNGLAGEDIPLSARVMAVADVFDALVSKRSYKEPFSFEKAVSIVKEGAGSHFDPRVVDAFIKSLPRIEEIHKLNMDE